MEQFNITQAEYNDILISLPQEIKIKSNLSGIFRFQVRILTRDERYNLMPFLIGHSHENIKIRKDINNFKSKKTNTYYHEEWLDSYSIPTHEITMSLYKKAIWETELNKIVFSLPKTVLENINLDNFIIQINDLSAVEQFEQNNIFAYKLIIEATNHEI